jgi:hypothetical protein
VLGSARGAHRSMAEPMVIDLEAPSSSAPSVGANGAAAGCAAAPASAPSQHGKSAEKKSQRIQASALRQFSAYVRLESQREALARVLNGAARPACTAVHEVLCALAHEPGAGLRTDPLDLDALIDQQKYDPSKRIIVPCDDAWLKPLLGQLQFTESGRQHYLLGGALRQCPSPTAELLKQQVAERTANLARDGVELISCVANGYLCPKAPLAVSAAAAPAGADGAAAASPAAAGAKRAREESEDAHEEDGKEAGTGGSASTKPADELRSRSQRLKRLAVVEEAIGEVTDGVDGIETVMLAYMATAKGKKFLHSLLQSEDRAGGGGGGGSGGGGDGGDEEDEDEHADCACKDPRCAAVDTSSDGFDMCTCVGTSPIRQLFSRWVPTLC